MTKKEILPYLIIIASGLVLYISASKILGIPMYNIDKKVFIHPRQTGKEGQVLPAFNILLADSTTNINTADIMPGKPIVLFYFGPFCPFCQSEIKEILENIDELKKIQFYVITTYPFPEMKSFYKQFQLEKYDNIQTGIDKEFFFAKYFNTINIPYIAIYGKDKRLKGAFLGKISYEQIIAVSRI